MTVIRLKKFKKVPNSPDKFPPAKYIRPRPARAQTLMLSACLAPLLALACLPGLTPLAAFADELNGDEINKLKLVEQKLFVRNYDDDSAEARIARIEKRMFGEADSGGVHERLAKIVEIAKPLDKPKTEPSRAGGTKFVSPQQKQQDAEDERLRQEDLREQNKIRAMQAAADEVNQLLSEGVSYYKSRRPAEAMEKFQQVVRLAPDNAQAYFSIGVIYEAQKRYKDAAGAYQRAAELDPEKRDYKEAVAIVMKKSAIDDDPQKAELNSLKEEAAAAYKRGEYMSALDLYRQLDEKSPRQALIKYNIGLIYLALKNPVQAREQFEAAYKLKPDEPHFKEAYERLGGSAQSSNQSGGGKRDRDRDKDRDKDRDRDRDKDKDKGWDHPGKTNINFVGEQGGTGGGGNRGGAKMPPPAESYGLMLKHKGDGVEILTVGIGSRAARCGLLRGDVIKAIDGMVVESTDQINQLFSSKPQAQFQLLIQRGQKIGQIVF